MVTRRQAREWALQLLVQFDMNPPDSVTNDIAKFWIQQSELEQDALEDDVRGAKAIFTSSDEKVQASLAEMREFAEQRVNGVREELKDLDELVERHLHNWSLYRLGTVERNVLRLGAWELKHCPDIHQSVIVNEAIDLAKFFSESKSGKFVNAVMDNLAKSVRSSIDATASTAASGGETFTP